MDMTQLLGMPLPEAETLLKAAGLSPKITYTSDPRNHREDGTPRILRATQEELIVARFRDGEPAE